MPTQPPATARFLPPPGMKSSLKPDLCIRSCRAGLTSPLPLSRLHGDRPWVTAPGRGCCDGPVALSPAIITDKCIFLKAGESFCHDSDEVITAKKQSQRPKQQSALGLYLVTLLLSPQDANQYGNLFSSFK